MTWYNFTGNNAFGQKIQGKHNADSELVLMSRLQAANITITSISKMTFFQTAMIKLKQFSRYFFPVRKADIALFYYQLADMLEIGIPIKQALLVIANHLNNPKLMAIIHDIIENLSKGFSFSESLSKHTRVFSEINVQLIAFSHTKEELTAVLRYCDQSMRSGRFLNKLLFIIFPQISITIVFFMCLLFLRFHYLQSFYYALSIFRNPLPPIIHMFDVLTGLFSVHLLKTTGYVIAVFVVCRIILFYSVKVRFFWHTLLYYFPVVGGVIIAFERERLSLLYSVLLKGGENVQQCAQYSAAVIRNLFFKHRVVAMFAAIRRGENFSNALRFFNIFGAAEVQMIALGAVSNNLAKTFGRLYSISQMILERKLMILLECVRFMLYIINVSLFFFAIIVTETLFFYPSAS